MSHLVQRMRPYERTVFGEMSALATTLGAVNLGQGFPDTGGPRQVREAAERAIAEGHGDQYPPAHGYPDLRTAISEHQRRFYDLYVDPAKGVVVTTGASEAIASAVLALVEPDDEVMVLDPYFDLYAAAIALAGAQRVAVPLTADALRPDLAGMRAAVTPRTTMLLLNTPHNPTGAVLSAAEIAEIGAVCRKHDLWIVADEVYEDLILQGTFASPFDRADLADRTIVCSSISKSHAAPGFRSGWAVGPVAFCERLLPVSEIMLFGGQPFIADMTAHALTHDIPTAATMRAAYARRAALVCKALAGTALKPLSPEAGMFLLIDVRATGLSGDAFARGLLDAEHVATMPGASFGAQAEGFIRLSLTVPDDKLAEACDRIARFAARKGAREVAE